MKDAYGNVRKHCPKCDRYLVDNVCAPCVQELIKDSISTTDVTALLCTLCAHIDERNLSSNYVEYFIFPKDVQEWWEAYKKANKV